MFKVNRRPPILRRRQRLQRWFFEDGHRSCIRSLADYEIHPTHSIVAPLRAGVRCTERDRLVIVRVRARVEGRDFIQADELFDGSVANECAFSFRARIEYAGKNQFRRDATLASEPDAPDRVLQRGGGALQHKSVACEDHAEAGFEQILPSANRWVVAWPTGCLACDELGMRLLIVAATRSVEVLQTPDIVSWEDNTRQLQRRQLGQPFSLFGHTFRQPHRSADQTDDAALGRVQSRGAALKPTGKAPGLQRAV